ncbi:MULTISPECIES: helix-turn-helix domain-containing protein [unclassified Neptuniibacter]|uniref:transcriptional regulator n=1 Tax=unclassified Neptuniibacter TaxID=2630693 RepID=UPI000C5362A1|nr:MULTISPECIES: helix-turn-helix domain-containing protein [unclassified Neptuniibacter]MAY41705.1 chaperone [Oceanospirillaceae bacterium]|tara:strand:- start:10074 stop:10295 length:222 start_codon:yes stop_codon:yes gene_type:complete
MSAIKRAIKILGSQTALAEELGVTPQAVQQWEASGTVPVKRVIEIEKATNGKVSRQKLRPDIYPSEAQSHKAA